MGSSVVQYSAGARMPSAKWGVRVLVLKPSERGHVGDRAPRPQAVKRLASPNDAVEQTAGSRSLDAAGQDT